MGDLTAFRALSPARADEIKVTPELVRFGPDIEPLVRLIEEVPNEKSAELLVEQLRAGVPYRRLLAALFLAANRNLSCTHVVYAIHSAQELALEARPEERLLPLFFAMDHFKTTTERRFWPNDFLPLRPFTTELPSADKALDELQSALSPEGWDREKAERAIVALTRTQGEQRLLEMLWPFVARDYRHVGHKAIHLANATRTLGTIGWDHAEHVLRGVVRELFHMEPKFAQFGFTLDNQCYVSNRERIRKVSAALPPTWAQSGVAQSSQSGGTLDLLALMRDGKSDDACDLAAAELRANKTDAGAVWDAVHLAAAELMLRTRHPLFAVHALTSMNAMHHGFRTVGEPETRLFILLQAVGWMCHFQTSCLYKKVPLRDSVITDLAPGALPAADEDAATAILTGLSQRRDEASSQVFALVQRRPEPHDFMRQCRRLLLMKSHDVHDYKYHAAFLEDFWLTQPRWRPHLLASALQWFPGSELPDSPVMSRAREAVRTL
jgi:hypothetical protein